MKIPYEVPAQIRVLGWLKKLSGRPQIVSASSGLKIVLTRGTSHQLVASLINKGANSSIMVQGVHWRLYLESGLEGEPPITPYFNALPIPHSPS